jgi:hypothetical protein
MSEGIQSPAGQQIQEEDLIAADFDPIAAIIAVGTWIASNPELVGKLGGAIGELTGWVTGIQAWSNQTDQEVKVWAIDGWNTQGVTVPPNNIQSKEIWVPWADNPGQYMTKKIGIMVGGQSLAYIWQNGPLVRFNTRDQWVADAPGVPGVSKSGGARSVAIAKNAQGQVGFAVVRNLPS